MTVFCQCDTIACRVRGEKNRPFFCKVAIQREVSFLLVLFSSVKGRSEMCTGDVGSCGSKVVLFTAGVN